MFKRRTRRLFWMVILIGLMLGLGAIFIIPAMDGQSPPELVINELLVSNGNGLTDEDGDTPDWIEIYNPGTQPVNLSGWSLTDNPIAPEKWVFPDITLAGGDYLIIFASGKNRRSVEPGFPLHTNFKLRQQGEFLGLYHILDEQYIDKFDPRYPPQDRDLAYGRLKDLFTFAYLTPTPGQPNDLAQSWEAVVAPVEFSEERGFVDSPLSVVLTTTTPGATIRYTLDGSTPAEDHGQIYSNPILVETTSLIRAAAFKPGFLTRSSQTHSYIFPADVLRQPADPPGFPPGADYEMDARIVNDPRVGARLLDALTAIPSVSLVTDISNMDIYQNPTERGVEWERPVSVEFIDPAAPDRNFQIDAGVRIQGGVGREPVFPKHSFRLFFKGTYGATKLEQPLFSDSPVTLFDTLVLRGGVNRSFAGYIGLGNRAEDLRKTTYTRDQWLRMSQIEMSGLGSHGMFVHLYLNGLYWGLYNIVERPDAAFTSAYLGGEKDEWFAGNLDGTITGDSARFEAIHQLDRGENLVDPAKYTEITSLLDIEQFIDYVILNFYAGNTDWAHNNWYVGNRMPNGPVMYFVWDGEKTWFDGANTYLGKQKFGGKSNQVMRLFNALIQNPDFKTTFADRLYRHLSGGGALTDSNSIARWRAINAPIEKAIVAESARWGDVSFNPPLTEVDWRRAYEDVLAQMDGNADRLISLARQAGYYAAIEPPVFNLPGGSIKPGFELEMRLQQTGVQPQAPQDSEPKLTSQGTIFYTLNGVDPRQPVSGEIATDARAYQAPIPLTTTIQVKARAYADGQWSALNEAVFYSAEQPGKLLITEVMYNPPEGGDHEFIELKNNGDGIIDLGGASFDGIRFTFPPNTPPLRSGEYIVLVRNNVAFAEKYPGVRVAGTYQGQLSNGGETIALRNKTGRIIVSVTYDDNNGWPLSPDGRGDSLTLVETAGDPNAPESWQASGSLGGSPGTDGSAGLVLQ